MDNPTFVDEEGIPLVHQDDDYDDYYRTPGTSRIDETSFTVPNAQEEATSTLQLRQEVKRDKINALYRHLDVKGNPGLISLERFRLTKDPNNGVTIFEFYNGNSWVPLAKQTGEFYASKTITDAFGKVNAMKNFLGIKTTPPSLERSISDANKLKSELPTDFQMESIALKGLSSLVEGIQVKTREASQNTNIDMREFLAIDKALQSIQGELLNNTSKLTETNKRIKRDTKKLEEVENDLTYSDEQRRLYKDRLDDPNTEKQTRLEILSQNRKDLQTQIARIKQTLEKVFDKNTPLPERILILISEQIVVMILTLTSFVTGIATILLSAIGDLGGGGGGGGPPSKDKETLKK